MAELFFGDFRFDTRRLTLEGSDGPLEVRARTLEVLTYLITNRNRFVSRRELMEELWREVHVTGSSVTQCISELRGILKDSARSPNYIETRVKYGYRFVATIYHKPTEILEPLPPPKQAEGEIPTFTLRKGRMIGIFALLAVFFLGGAWLLFRQKVPTIRKLRLTSVVEGSSDTTAEKMAEAVRMRIVADLEEIPGIVLEETDSSLQANLSSEISTRRTTTGRLEIVAVLRNLPKGQQIWSGTWVFPAEDHPPGEDVRKIADQILHALDSSGS